MNDKDFKEFESKYFLITKNRFWSFMGGVVGLLVLAGIISYQGAIQALRTTRAQNTLKKLQATDDKATRMIQKLDLDSGTLEQRIKQAGGVIAAGELTLKLDTWDKDGWDLLDLNDEIQPRTLEYTKSIKLPDVVHPNQVTIIAVLTGYKLKYSENNRNKKYPYALKCMVLTGRGEGDRIRIVGVEITPAENFDEVYVSWFAVRTPNVEVIGKEAWN